MTLSLLVLHATSRRFEIRLRKGPDLDEPSPSGLYLGCMHEPFVAGTKGAGHSYNMESFFRACVNQYVSLTGFSDGVRSVPTPFLPEDQNMSVAGRTPRPLLGVDGRECPWCRIPFDLN